MWIWIFLCSKTGPVIKAVPPMRTTEWTSSCSSFAGVMVNFTFIYPLLSTAPSPLPLLGLEKEVGDEGEMEVWMIREWSGLEQWSPTFLALGQVSWKTIFPQTRGMGNRWAPAPANGWEEGDFPSPLQGDLGGLRLPGSLRLGSAGRGLPHPAFIPLGVRALRWAPGSGF